jgi:phosphate butyryltransferase
MLKSFSDVVERAKNKGRVTVSVSVAQDREVLMSLKQAYDLGLVQPVLVGDESLIKPLAEEAGLPDTVQIVNVENSDEAALKAAELVHDGEAQVLMKGIINSSNFLRAALNEKKGLRSGRILCHMAAFEIPGEKKLVFHVDGGMNIAPNLQQKKEIIINAIYALKAFGIEKPNIAVLAANELVNPKMPATTDAKALVEMAEAGELPPCVIEGPIAMDVAASAEAAKHKGIASKISGNVDLFVVPDIEAGNMVGKTLVYYAKAKFAGVVLGAANPIVLTSRSDTAEAKLNSIALACLLA